MVIIYYKKLAGSSPERINACGGSQDPMRQEANFSRTDGDTFHWCSITDGPWDGLKKLNLVEALCNMRLHIPLKKKTRARSFHQSFILCQGIGNR
jgi:hypothetical protein